MVRYLQRIRDRLALHKVGNHARCRYRSAATECFEFRIGYNFIFINFNIEPHNITAYRIADIADAAGIRDLAYIMGIFEMFLVDDEVRNMINNNASTIALRQRARELGMRTLREDGIRKVLAGMTTAEEVLTTTMTDLD